jgi:hypothetical protein
MNGPWPLAFDAGDLIKILMILLFLVISVVGHFANKWREMQEEAARRARARRPSPPSPQQRPQDDEIAEFLRNANQRQRPAGHQPPPPPPPSPTRPSVFPPRPRVEEPLEAEVVAPSTGHLRETLAARTLTSSSSGPLGGEVAQSDDRLQGHLHQVFDHQLSDLSTGEASSTAPTAGQFRSPSPAMAPSAGLVSLLTNADSLRQAIILSEILNRPEHRWE